MAQKSFKNPEQSFNLLDLPTELVRLIILHFYGTWTFCISEGPKPDHPDWVLTLSGYPSQSLLTTCRTLHGIAKEAEVQSFTGIVKVEEKAWDMSCLCFGLVDRLASNKHSKYRYRWLKKHVKTMIYSNTECNPAVWKFRGFNYRCFTNLQRIELDCRFPSLFAIHSVKNAAAFLSGKDGRLEKQMDYRHAYFLSCCEKFLLESVRHGIAVTVVREMGVRELNERCLGVVVAIDYIDDGSGNLILDWKSLKSRSAPIVGWPHNIRPTLAQLQL